MVFTDSFGENDSEIYESVSGIALFIEFEYRINSLKRYLDLADQAVQESIRKKQKDLVDFTASIKQMRSKSAKDRTDEEQVFLDFEFEAIMWQEEQFLSDKEYFSEYVYMSIIAVLFSLVESVLDAAAEVAAEKPGIKTKVVEIKVAKMPYITKYLYYLNSFCGLDVKVDESVEKSLHTLRKIRNRFLHSLGKDLPEEVKRELVEVLELSHDTGFKIDYQFTLVAFKTVVAFVSSVDRAFEEKFNF